MWSFQTWITMFRLNSVHCLSSMRAVNCGNTHYIVRQTISLHYNCVCYDEKPQTFLRHLKFCSLFKWFLVCQMYCYMEYYISKYKENFNGIKFQLWSFSSIVNELFDANITEKGKFLSLLSAFVSEVDSLFTFVLQEYLILLTFLILKICFAVFVSLC